MAQHMSLHPAHALRVEGVALRRVSIEPAPALGGEIALLARYEAEAEFAELRILADRDGALVVSQRVPDVEGSTRTALTRFAGWILRRPRVAQADLVGRRLSASGRPDPTLELEFRVPFGCDLGIDLLGACTLAIGDVGGRVALDLSGAVEARIHRACGLGLDAMGSVRARVETCEDDAGLTLAGEARVEIGAMGGGDLDATLSGAAHLTVEGGEINDLSLDLSDACRAPIAAPVLGRLAFAGSGLSEADLARVDGRIAADHSGPGTLRVAGLPVPSGS